MNWHFLRPPGAEAESEFLKRCLQCGQCVQACPYHSIVITTGFDIFQSGTPRIIPRQIPCYLCMRCGPACPSGALKIVPPENAGMGRAVLDRNLCFTYEGTVICRSCFERCPLKARAIILDKGLYPVITEACVGCGVCDHVCPRKAIAINASRGVLAWWSRLVDSGD